MGKRVLKQAQKPAYRVHTFGPGSSGKPVSSWYSTKKEAEKVAKRMNKKTGRRYIVLKRVSGVV